MPGVLVITSRAVLFEQWDEQARRYDVVKRLVVRELREVSLDSYGLNRRLVIRKKDLSFDTFDFTQGRGSFIDASKVEEGYHFLQHFVGVPEN